MVENKVPSVFANLKSEAKKFKIVRNTEMWFLYSVQLCWLYETTSEDAYKLKHSLPICFEPGDIIFVDPSQIDWVMICAREQDEKIFYLLCRSI